MQYKEKKYYLKCKSKNINTKLPRKNINRYKYYKQLYKQFGGVNIENVSNNDKASMNNDLSDQIKELTNIVNSLQQNQLDIKNTINTQTEQLKKIFEGKPKQLEDITTIINNKIDANTKHLENTFTTKLQEQTNKLTYNPTEEKKYIDLLLNNENIDKNVDYYRDIICKYQLYLDHSNLWKAQNNNEYMEYNTLYTQYISEIDKFDDTDKKLLIKHYSSTDYDASYDDMIIRLQDYILDELLNIYYDGLTTHIKNKKFTEVITNIVNSVSENIISVSENMIPLYIKNTYKYNDYFKMMENININTDTNTDNAINTNTDNAINTNIISLYDVIIRSKCCPDNSQKYSSNKKKLTNFLLENSSDKKYILKIIIISFITNNDTQDNFIHILESLGEKFQNINETNMSNVILYFALCYKLSKQNPKNHSDILKQALNVLKHNSIDNIEQYSYNIHFYKDGVKYYYEYKWDKLLRVYNSENYQNEMNKNNFVNFHKFLFDLTPAELNLLNQEIYLTELKSKNTLNENEIILLFAVCEKLCDKSEFTICNAIIQFIKENNFNDQFYKISINIDRTIIKDKYIKSASRFNAQQVIP